MRKLTQFLFVTLILAAVVSCKPKETIEEITAGDVDATRYISIGGTITAGFMDDGLYYDGQNNSLGALIAQQFQLIGAGEFTQPLMPLNSVGYDGNGLARLILGYKTDCESVTSLSPVRIASQGDLSGFGTYVYNAVDPFNNFGIPFLKSTQYNISGIGNPSNGPGNYNPFFTRMASNPMNATVKADILAANPTFFTLFTGMDEVLEFAQGGAASGVLTPVNGSVGVGFDGSVEDLLIDLTTSGAKGAISTIPDVTEFPYFTTIPFDGLDLDEESAQSLNDIYNPIGISFHVGKNAFVIEDPDAGAFGVRQMVEGEMILLSVPLDSVKCFKMGSVFPFRNEFILTANELSDLRSTIISYNIVIQNFASEYNLALVDSYSFFKNLKTGIVYNGISMNAKFVSGGAFSLDGATLNPRGNALLANKFLNAINLKYNSKIPALDVTKFRGVIFP